MTKFQIGDRVLYMNYQQVEIVVDVYDTGCIVTDYDLVQLDPFGQYKFGTHPDKFTLVKSIESIEFDKKLEGILNE